MLLTGIAVEEEPSRAEGDRAVAAGSRAEEAGHQGSLAQDSRT